MPDQPAATPVQPLHHDAAYAAIMQRAYAPVFFQKLANDFGIQFATDQARFAALTHAGQLRQAYDEEQAKQASYGDPVLAHMQRQLSKMASAQPSPMLTHHIQQVAGQLAADPEMAHAVLSMHAAAQPAAA